MRFCISSFFKYFNDTYIIFLHQSDFLILTATSVAGAADLISCFLRYKCLQLPCCLSFPFLAPCIHRLSVLASVSPSSLFTHTHSCKFILNLETHFPAGNCLHEKILMSFLFLATISKNVIGFVHLFWVLPQHLDSPTCILALSTSS